MDRLGAGAKRLVGLRAFRGLHRGDGRAATDRVRQLRNLGATLGAANRLQLLEVGLRARRGAHFDHRLALDGDRVRIVGLELQRLVGHPDCLAKQMLFFGDTSDVHECAPIARIDREGGFEKILSLLKLAGADRFVRLALQLYGFGQDLVVGALADRWRGERQATAPISRERAKDCINLSITLDASTRAAAVRRKIRRCRHAPA